jgi:hypothetical protein
MSVPERPETLAAQMAWLAEGKRKAVLVPPGSPLPVIPDGVRAHPTRAGLFLYAPAAVSEAEVDAAVAEDRIGDLLGYCIPAKPSRPTAVVVVRGRNGEEKQAVVTDKAHLRRVKLSARALAGVTDRVCVEPPESVLTGRHALSSYLECRRLLGTVEELREVRAAARSDGHEPFLPTHVFRRDGAVVGYAGVGSVPLVTVWLHSEDVKPRDTLGALNLLENLVRVSGSPMVVTLVAESSPFAGAMARLGYAAMERWRAFGKKL